MTMRLVTYLSGGTPRSGIVLQDTVHDAARLTGNDAHADITKLLADWKDVRARAVAAASGSTGLPLSEQQLAAPVPHPGAIYAAGANYIDHIVEMRGPAAAATARPEGSSPFLFVKSSWSVVGPQTDIAMPTNCKSLDWEAELAVIIGGYGKDVPVEDALSIVAGYTIANDLSARDLFRRSYVADNVPFHFDWLRHKSFEGACPLGPWIVMADDIPDPQKLDISLSVNGVEKQRSHTSQMIYSVAEQISQVSRSIGLRPGDVILTGTPAGVGAGKNTFLNPGDQVSVTIEKIGTLNNRIVAGEGVS